MLGPGLISELFGVLVIALMLGIQISGNYGTFNLLCGVVSISMLECPGSASPPPALYQYGLLIMYCLLGAAALPWDSFTALTWCFSQRCG